MTEQPKLVDLLVQLKGLRDKVSVPNLEVLCLEEALEMITDICTSVSTVLNIHGGHPVISQPRSGGVFKSTDVGNELSMNLHINIGKIFASNNVQKSIEDTLMGFFGELSIISSALSSKIRSGLALDSELTLNRIRKNLSKYARSGFNPVEPGTKQNRYHEVLNEDIILVPDEDGMLQPESRGRRKKYKALPGFSDKVLAKLNKPPK